MLVGNGRQGADIHQVQQGLVGDSSHTSLVRALMAGQIGRVGQTKVTVMPAGSITLVSRR
jgi:hypothetical protein